MIRREYTMSETERRTNNFIAYEYKDVTVSRDMEMLYADSFPSFGWKLEERSPSIGLTSVNLKFKRDRRIANRVELTRLQREYEGHIEEIERLERAKLIAPSAAAYGVGIAGAAFMAGSVFSYLANMIVLCIVLAIPAFAGWIVPYFAYLRIKKSKSDKAAPLIDRKYESIYEVCDRANNLVSQ